MPRVCFPVRWSSLRTIETSAPRATSLRFRPSMELTPFTAASRTANESISAGTMPSLSIFGSRSPSDCTHFLVPRTLA
jgi:hypothetical protein